MAKNPEALLISSVVQTGEYQHLAKHGITSTMFHVYDHEMKWMTDFIQRVSKAPSKAALRQQFPEFVIYKVDDVEHWCDKVREEHKRQSMMDLVDEVLELIDDDDQDAALNALRVGVETIDHTSRGLNADFNVFDEWETVYADVAARVDRVKTHGHAGIPTGFKTLDDLTGGLQGGWFCVLAARLGQGKTWSGVKMSFSAAMAGYNVAYFSLEQSKLQIALRVHAFGSREYAAKAFNPMDLNKGTGFDLMAYKKFLKRMKNERGNGNFYINDTSRGIVTPATIGAVIQQKQPDIVFIDYLTLLGTTSDDWRGTAKLSSELQTIAQKYNVPIVAMSQINRMGISADPPGAEHLSQADAIGQDADLVLTMMQQSKSVMKMKLAKFRHGSGGGMWYAKFSPGTGEYEEISAADAQDLIDDDDMED